MNEIVISSVECTQLSQVGRCAQVLLMYLYDSMMHDAFSGKRFAIYRVIYEDRDVLKNVTAVKEIL